MTLEAVARAESDPGGRVDQRVPGGQRGAPPPAPLPDHARSGRQDFRRFCSCQAVVGSAHQVTMAYGLSIRHRTSGRRGHVGADHWQPRHSHRGGFRQCGLLPGKEVDRPHARGVGPFIAAPGTGCGRSRERGEAGSAHAPLMEEMVEPAFDQIKQRWGFRQFLRQGLEKMNGNGC